MTESWEVLETLGTEEEAAIIAGFLDSRGVECRVESLLFHQEPVTFGGLGVVRVLVPAARLAEARAVLEERRGRFPVVAAADEDDDEDEEDEEEDGGAQVGDEDDAGEDEDEDDFDDDDGGERA